MCLFELDQSLLNWLALNLRSNMWIIIDYIDQVNGHKCTTLWAIIINGLF